MGKYKQMSSLGIPGFSHPIANDLMEKVTKFARNNAITIEENLKNFIDMLNDYVVEHEDVVMKLFVHSLIEDVRDCFTRLPDDNIKS